MEKQDEEEKPICWKDLKLEELLVEECEERGWSSPTEIQKKAIPVIIETKDVVCIAETGSGKTGAFALPIIHALLKNPQRCFALVLTPTKELAAQVADQFRLLAKSIDKFVCEEIIGGVNISEQRLHLAKKPHIIVATPGRLLEHLNETKGFNLNSLKFLVMDEADKMLDQDFEVELKEIIKKLPKTRQTLLFSATMTKKLNKIKRASLKNPTILEVSKKYQTVDNLKQSSIFIPFQYKDIYLVHILNKLANNTFVIFCGTCDKTIRLSLMLRHLGFTAIPINGKMSQEKRTSALEKFKNKKRSILVATDVASRGLDIPHITVVINYDIPSHSKDYIHRVGRTARAGKSGQSVSIVSQFDVDLFQRIEESINMKIPAFENEKNTDRVVALWEEKVAEARRKANMESRDSLRCKKFGKRKKAQEADEDDDSEQALGVVKRLKSRG